LDVGRDIAIIGFPEGGDFGPKRPGIPEQKDQTFRCMKTKFSGPKRPTYPHFQALAV
jgi:hypothetical protein